MKTQKSISIIMKPTSQCNFRCSYCYHSETEYKLGILPVSKLKKLIALAQREYDKVQYIWHGGEPLLCGLDYFKTAYELQKAHMKDPEQIINNGVQTNGSLLNDEFISFFLDNHFDIGISFDGPGECNSMRESTELVENAMSLCRERKLPIGTLSVIHAGNCDKQIEMYEYFKKKRFSMKFSPVFASGGAEDNDSVLLTAERYIESLKKLFEHWLFDENAARISPISDYMDMLEFGRSRECVHQSCLYNWLCMDSEGNLYPCGRAYPKEYRLGKITSLSKLSDVFLSPAYQMLLSQSIRRRDNCMANCDFYSVCQGGCNNTFLVQGMVEQNGGFFCDVILAMYSYIKERIDAVNADDSLRAKIKNKRVLRLLKNATDNAASNNQACMQ